MKYLEDQTDKVKHFLNLVKLSAQPYHIVTSIVTGTFWCSEPFKSMEPVEIDDQSYNVIQVLYIEYKPDNEGTAFYFQLIYRIPEGPRKDIIHPDDIPEELLDKMINHLMSNLLAQKEHDKRNN